MIHFNDLMNLVGFLIVSGLLFCVMLFLVAWASDAKQQAEDRVLRNVRYTDDEDAKEAKP